MWLEGGQGVGDERLRAGAGKAVRTFGRVLCLCVCVYVVCVGVYTLCVCVLGTAVSLTQTSQGRTVLAGACFPVYSPALSINSFFDGGGVGGRGEIEG